MSHSIARVSHSLVNRSLEFGEAGRSPTTSIVDASDRVVAILYRLISLHFFVIISHFGAIRGTAHIRGHCGQTVNYGRTGERACRLHVTVEALIVVTSKQAGAAGK